MRLSNVCRLLFLSGPFVNMMTLNQSAELCYLLQGVIELLWHVWLSQGFEELGSAPVSWSVNQNLYVLAP